VKRIAVRDPPCAEAPRGAASWSHRPTANAGHLATDGPQDQQATGNWQLATGNWQKLATGNWQLATGNWQLATGNWQLAIIIRFRNLIIAGVLLPVSCCLLPLVQFPAVATK
jgi:hypothetical protein